MFISYVFLVVLFFQAEDGIRDLVRSRGLGDVYKRQELYLVFQNLEFKEIHYKPLTLVMEKMVYLV